MKNYKTTIAGICAIIPVALHALFPTVVTSEVAAELFSLFASLGLIAAQDGKGNTPAV